MNYKTQTRQKLENGQDTLKSNNIIEKLIKPTTKSKNVTKRNHISHKTTIQTTSSTKNNAKITQSTKTTTSSTTSTTETVPTSAPSAFEALKRNIFSLFPKNIDMNFNILNLFDFLKSFIS